jgi:hypothetical protein
VVIKSFNIFVDQCLIVINFKSYIDAVGLTSSHCEVNKRDLFIVNLCSTKAAKKKDQIGYVFHTVTIFCYSGLIV